MTDATSDASQDGQATAEQAALAAEGVPVAIPPAAPSGAAPADERPELLVGAAFAGGLALALLLKRLAR